MEDPFWINMEIVRRIYISNDGFFVKKSNYLTIKIFPICLLISCKSDNITSTTNDPTKIKPSNISLFLYINVSFEIVQSSIGTNNFKSYRLYESINE